MIIGIIVGVVVLFLLVCAGSPCRIVREYQRIVLFRLGRAVGTRARARLDQPGHGPHDLGRPARAVPRDSPPDGDHQGQRLDLDRLHHLLQGGRPLDVGAARGRFAAAAQNVAATTLRSVVGDMPLDDVLSKREEMNASLRVRLDEVTERWGVKVTTVEVREVNPPPGVLEAMTRQMSAERTRRAAVTEAEGQKQAAVTLAEGTKQAAILAAEGERQSAHLARRRPLDRAGEDLEVARGLDANTMQLQYLETLKQVGSSPSTKIVVPMELGGLLNGLRNMLPGDRRRQVERLDVWRGRPSDGDGPLLGTITALGDASS